MLIPAYTSADGTFHWIDVVEPTPEELETLARQYGFHPLAIHDSLDPKHLPKYEKFDDTQFLILRGYDQYCPASASTVRELTRKVSCFFGDTYLITIHRIEQPFMQQIRDSWIKNPVNIQGDILSKLLAHLISEILGTYRDGLDLCKANLDQHEAMLFKSKSTSTSLKQAFLIKRKIFVFKQMLKMSMEVLPKLKIISEYDPSLLVDIKEFCEGRYFETDQVQNETTNLMSLHLALGAHNTNKIIRILTIFSVFFSPLTFIAGIYGMNFDYMPELRYMYGYPAVLIFMGLLCLFLYLWFKKKGLLKDI